MAKRRTLPEMTDFDIRLLRVFAAVSEAGGFSAAEVGLNKSKSSISIDISSLESRLGLRLCRRGREGFALTAEGEKILCLVKDLFASLNGFRDGAGRIASLVEGQLTLILDDNFPLWKQAELTKTVKEFHTAYPQVFLTVRTASPDEVVKSVLNGIADIGISAAPREVAGAIVEPIFDERMVLCCADGHPLITDTEGSVAEEDLLAFDFIDIVTRQCGRTRKVLDGFRIQAKSPTVQSRLLLILSGQYIGFLPQELVEPYIAARQIRTINAKSMSYDNTCSLIVRDEVSPSNAQISAIRLLRNNFAAGSTPPRLRPVPEPSKIAARQAA
jgi:LysR family transcriptional regulator, transcriptional activator for bauABCD operon